MAFQIHALSFAPFAHLFTLSEQALAEHRAIRLTVDESPGTPCRVSLQDANVGDTVVLVNYRHLPEHSPYQSSHAIFIRESATQAIPAPNTVPPVISHRLISVRAFNEHHLMVDADVTEGTEVGGILTTFLSDSNVAYCHLHNAKQGCFAASVTRPAL